MADSRRYWKESIGVIPGRGKKRSRSPAAKGPSAAPQRVAAALDDARQELAARGNADTLTGVQKSGHAVALANVCRTLESLPAGSMDFARQVTRHLWPASPADIRRLDTIVEAYPLLSPPARNAVGNAVLVRAQGERLLERAPEPTVSALLTRASHWRRLEELAGRTRQLLSGGDDDKVLRAALELVPESVDLVTNAHLAESMAEVVDALAGNVPRGAALSLPALGSAAPAIADSLKGEKPSLLTLEVGSAICRALVALDQSRRDELAPLRRLLGRVSERLEGQINEVLRAHRRDPEATASLAALRRHLRDVRSRLDEAMLDSAVTAPVASGARPEPTDGDQQILDHLAQVEEQAEGSDEEKNRWKRWIGWSLMGGALLLVGTIRSLLPSPLPPVPDVVPADFAPATVLTRVDPAGALLVATADPAWDAADAWSRRQQAVRLMSLAEKKGFRAGLLIAVDGRPLASWSPGRPPLLREGPGRAAMTPQSPVARRLRATMFERDGQGGIQHAP
ncbi:MAG: hypothetical protein Q9Q40_06200 [Acidobacteriota bacterium]|nr:hypothetical protein [Acidobacteriota bacterium]MDQ7086655.1 hypothetical protein [Acidobacteriota bacterium]